MAAPWSPRIHSHATRSKPLAAMLPQLAVTAHPLPVLTRTDAQAHKDIYARKISDKWACSKSRRNKASRGLMNVGNSCYQTAALQQLYHLRKFMNWILTHNVRKRGGDVLNPCDPTQRVANECVACVMKNLIGKYWGTSNLTAGTPNALPTHDADMVAMQRIVDAWFPLDLDRRTMLRTYRHQQDAEEFQTLLLQACLSSTDILQ
jgi:ubiquitin C-terminal hydrolase